MQNLPAAMFNQIAKQPSPLLMQVGNDPYNPCNSTQIHHLIPHELWRDLDFLQDPHVLQVLNSAGYGEEGPFNLMELPSTVNGALLSGFALHNGSHPKTYSEEVTKKVIEIEKKYNETIANHPYGQGQTMADTLLLAEFQALDLNLTRRLDRSSGEPGQLALSLKDPNIGLVDPRYQHEMRTLGSVVDDVNANPRSAFPTKAMAENACKLTEKATAEALAERGLKLRIKAWAHIPEQDRPQDIGAGVLALQELQQRLPEIKQSEIESIRAQPTSSQPDPHTHAPAANPVQAKPTFTEIIQQTAQEHPFDAAMATVGVGLMAGAGLLAVGGSAAVGGAAELVSGSTLALGATTSVIVTNPAQALPAYDSMNAGRDDMGERSNVDHISWRFTGLPVGAPGNSMAALAARDTAPDRAGGALAYCGAHLLVKADGTIEQDSTHARPLNQNPQIDAGNNGNAIGVYVEGDGKLTTAQRATLTSLNDTLSQQRLQAGELTRSILTPATITEDMAWDGTSLNPALPNLGSPALNRPSRRTAPAVAGGM